MKNIVVVEAVSTGLNYITDIIHRNYHPLVIVSGSENGVILANRLSADLGLKGNPIEILNAMTQKHAMQLALKKAGIRYILGRVVTSVEEAMDFCKEKN